MVAVRGVVRALKPFSMPDDGIRIVPHYDLEDDRVVDLPVGQITVEADAEAVLALEAEVAGKLLRWDTDAPNLYASLVTLEVDGKAIDRKYARFGWREFKIKAEDFYLNDRKIRIKADAWHFIGHPPAHAAVRLCVVPGTEGRRWQWGPPPRHAVPHLLPGGSRRDGCLCPR